MDSPDVVVAGGGIIGLSIALELARAGLRVRVLERDRAMAAASWAAAGMLAAEDPENPAELAELSLLSRSLYPEYLDQLRGLSGQAIPIRTRNTLQGSIPGGLFRCSETSTRTFLSGQEAAERIPGIRTEGRSFLWLEELSLDPRDLCLALPLAAAAAGVSVEEGCEVLAVMPRTGGVLIATSKGDSSAGAFVNCCGAWASTIRQDDLLSPTAVEPRKGQMAMVRLDQHRLQHAIRTPAVYAVPRGDQRIVIGASVEQAGFDCEIDEKTTRRLVEAAAELWPPLREATVTDRWAGLRPGTGDHLPFIGRSASPRYLLATGHFRNGILLAPATAVVMGELLTGRAPRVSLDAFCIPRFAPQRAG